MRRPLALELTHATESAAIAAARTMGRGVEAVSYDAAVRALRSALGETGIGGRLFGPEALDDGTEVDEELPSRSGEPLDLLTIPLEGTGTCASGGPNALSVIVAAQRGALLEVPQLYMDKVAVGPAARGAIDITLPPRDNLARVAEALSIDVGDLAVAILDRPRNRTLLREVRECGSRIRLISDGDVSATLATLLADSGVDALMGIGNALQGAISAVALYCAGDMQARLVAKSPEERRLAAAGGFDDPDRVLHIDDFVEGDAIVAATGVTPGDALRGVQIRAGRAITHSMVLRSETRSMRLIEAHHSLGRRPSEP